MMHRRLHKSVIEFGLIEHSAETDNMLRTIFHMIHVSLLQTSVCWQEKKEGFDVGPLGFLARMVKGRHYHVLGGPVAVAGK